MADHYRRPTGNNSESIPFSVEIAGQTCTGTLTPSGKVPAFGMPNTFIVRIPGSPAMNISIYMGKWIMPAREALAQPLSDWIMNHYK